MEPLTAAGVGPALGAGQVPGLHVVSLKPGAVRGNHYHPAGTEFLLVCDGPASLVWRATGDGPIHTIPVIEDDPALFEIPCGVAHAVLNTSKRDILAVAFYDVPKVETVRCDPPLLDAR